MVGACRRAGSCASGTVPAPAPSFGFHWLAPAGLFLSSHSKPKRLSQKRLLHFVCVWVHAPSRPLVIVWTPCPLPSELTQPKLWSSIFAAAGSRPTYLLGSS